MKITSSILFLLFSIYDADEPLFAGKDSRLKIKNSKTYSKAILFEKKYSLGIQIRAPPPIIQNTIKL
ncbi:hypothetical protein [Chryseobacterium lathyri]|uniref:hypothetical protein n=1 Tax=Chryseobacterium lathyri TaxID=395933 RepID=UPI002788A14D|nr:hypothetical protein [Chryseobacterium lathyri]MDQ0064386.1 hypothetical protein [Chryseobacterium lathyri]